MKNEEQEAAKVAARDADWEQFIEGQPPLTTSRYEYDRAHDLGFDAGIQHSRLPADGWREINGVEDLPKGQGRYWFTMAGGEVDWFDWEPGDERETRTILRRAIAWMPKRDKPAPYTPPPTEKEER